MISKSLYILRKRDENENCLPKKQLELYNYKL